MTDALLVVDPPGTIEFARPLDQGAATSLTLSPVSNATSHVVFKVKTTAPKLYYVRPNLGLLPRGSTTAPLDVTVCLLPPATPIPAEAKCRDKFLIQAACITDEEAAGAAESMDRIVELWAAIDKDPVRKSSVREHKLRCAYVDRSSSTTSMSINPTASISMHPTASVAMPTAASATQSVMSLTANVALGPTTTVSRLPQLDVLGVVATATALPPSPLVAAISLPASPNEAGTPQSPMTALAESAAGVAARVAAMTAAAAAAAAGPTPVPVAQAQAVECARGVESESAGMVAGSDSAFVAIRGSSSGNKPDVVIPTAALMGPTGSGSGSGIKPDVTAVAAPPASATKSSSPPPIAVAVAVPPPSTPALVLKKPPGPTPSALGLGTPVVSAPNVTAASSATAVYDLAQVTALEAEVARLQEELKGKNAAVAKLQAQTRHLHEQLATAQADADRAREEKPPRYDPRQQHPQQVVVVAADSAWSMQVLVAVAVAAFVGGAVLF
ncbi:phosphatidylinositol-binding protein scs2 [Allomyces arbusculus]|nr:phosphatidylinositol-binding protein scs2 [Allomyces arbusculus]